MPERRSASPLEPTTTHTVPLAEFTAEGEDKPTKTLRPWVYFDRDRKRHFAMEPLLVRDTGSLGALWPRDTL